MKHLKSAFLTLLLVAMATSGVYAQYVTTHAKMAMPGQQQGIYYALPRTVLKIDFVMEKIDMVKGPYSNYMGMIGGDDYVEEDAEEYRIVNVRMSTYAEADPQATFFVAFNKKGANDVFYLSPKGILQGVGMNVETTETASAESVMEQEMPSVDRTFKYHYGAKGYKSEEQMARAAADMINRIREEKIKLITGFQETSFALDTYRQMYADLEAMENEYLSLFVGKRIVKTVVKTVYVTPKKGVPTMTVGTFSNETGFTVGVAEGGVNVTVQLTSLNTTGSINQASQSAVESLSQDNKLFYRIPETANIKVNVDEETVLSCRATVAQLGAFTLAPLGNTKMAFDPNTGQVIRFGAE